MRRLAILLLMCLLALSAWAAEKQVWLVLRYDAQFNQRGLKLRAAMNRFQGKPDNFRCEGEAQWWCREANTNIVVAVYGPWWTEHLKRSYSILDPAEQERLKNAVTNNVDIFRVIIADDLSGWTNGWRRCGDPR